MITVKTIKKTALAPTVLITHGGGFLASQLAETLLLKNFRVVVLSNLKEHKDEDLQALLKSPKFALFDCDINTGLPDAINSVDYIFHLANYDSFINNIEKPGLEGLLSAGVGTKTLLDLAKKSQAKFVLLCPLVSKPKSVQKDVLTKEDAQKYSQALVSEYRERWSLDARLVFLGITYGPGMYLKNAGEFGGLVDSIIKNKPMEVSGDGSGKEFYLYITDAVTGLVKKYQLDIR